MATDFDLYTIRQVYTEGFKDGETAQHESMFEEIAAVIAVLLTRLGVKSLGELTKRQLTGLLSEVNKKVRAIFKREVNVTMAHLKRFMAADTGILKQVFRLTDTEPVTTVNDRLWSEVLNAPVAGVGEEPPAMLSTALSALLLDTTRTIKRGYADNMTVGETLAALVGTKGSRGGSLTKNQRQLRTALQTIIQHISAYVTFKIAATRADNYTWCAILDGRTTDICRSRNGHVYSFKDGPRPPAHWGCRSFIIPVTNVALADIPTFYTWIKSQPTAVQDEALGVTRGRKLRKGEIKADDLPGFDYTRPLTVDQYKARLTTVLGKVA